jgi:hypothetical protein
MSHPEWNIKLKPSNHLHDQFYSDMEKQMLSVKLNRFDRLINPFSLF